MSSLVSSQFRETRRPVRIHEDAALATTEGVRSTRRPSPSSREPGSPVQTLRGSGSESKSRSCNGSSDTDIGTVSGFSKLSVSLEFASDDVPGQHLAARAMKRLKP